ncbi:MAG: (Na+)-NQR maturation NqrM [Cardiobacteriaceae bacterium]|nr:(Na+)-NQR maturation NqrM [Cardiobacteriaceae bacterium]
MTVFAISFVIFMCVILAMSVGVLCGRKPIAGSCGGIANLGMEKACGCTDVCKNEEEKKAQEEKKTNAKVEIYRP